MFDFRRASLAAVALVGSVTAQATMIQVEMSGYVPTAPTSTGVIPTLAMGSSVTTSFILDTAALSSLTVNYDTFLNPYFPPVPVAEAFEAIGLATQSISLFIDGFDASPIASEVGSARFDGHLSSPSNGTDYDMFMLVESPSLTFSFIDFNTSPVAAITQSELLASVDPVATLLFRYVIPPAFAYIWGDFGRAAFQVQELTIREVPEPGVLLLFLGALPLLAVRRRKNAAAT